MPFDAPVCLVMRAERGFWNAYIASDESMEGAIRIGSLTIAAAMNKVIRDGFLVLMRDVVADGAASAGVEIVDWSGPFPAPTSPRARPRLTGSARMKWYTVEHLSPRQALTPDGYLIVIDTIIARCGEQIYHHHEVPLDPDDRGVVTVSRDATEVFRPSAIASFEGKPITDDHPDVEVTPENHRRLAVGHIQHVRQGDGEDSDCLIADLVFTDPATITKVRSRRKLALSAGYDAFYEQVRRGRGRQVRIIGNHVALVDEGRCGARCSIGDSGELIYSYLAAQAQVAHDAGHSAACGCAVCDRPAPARKGRRLHLWADGVRLWAGRIGKARDAFDPNEKRDEGGKWTTGGGGAGKSGPEQVKGGGNERSPQAANERRGVPGAPASALPAVFRRGTAGNAGGGGGRSDATPVRATFQSSDASSPAPVFHELGAGAGKVFAQHLADSKGDSKFGAAVNVYPEDEYNQMRLFLTPDSKAGFALHGDDIVSVFRRPDGPKGAVGSILALATQQGGRRLDCFDTVLPEIYGQRGFKAVARLPFSDQYAPEGWDRETYAKFNGGRPDVVFMTYDPSHAQPYAPGDGAKVADYDAGTAAQHADIGGTPAKARDAYDPSQPRAPKGAPGGGEWTASGGGGGSSGGATGKVSKVDFAHHDALKQAGFTSSSSDPDTYHGDHLTPSLFQQMDGYLKGKGFKGVSNTKAWTNPDFTHLEVVENSPSAGSTVKLTKMDGSKFQAVMAGAPAGAGTTGQSTEFVKGKAVPAEGLHGIPFASWAKPPKTDEDWERLAMKGKDFKEPALTTKAGAKQAAGVIIQEPDGRVWIVHPTNEFGGYKATYPKGTVEPGMSVRATAIKEAFEESGLQVELTGYAGDVQRETSMARYYFAKRVAGTPADAGWESASVTLAHPSDLKGFLNKSVDQDMVDKFITAKPAGPPPLPAAPPAPKSPTTASGSTLNLASMTKVGSQLGSNPGGKYADKDGKEFYVKISKSDDHAKNELLAARLYEQVGSAVLPAQKIELDGGKLGTATPWQKVDLINKNDADQRRLAQENFATHAWLANWDAAGLSYDNQGMVDGKMTTLDPGGALLYRAQGTPKGAAWGDSVGEWDSMRKGSNAASAALYGSMTGQQLRASALKVAKISDHRIDALVQEHGPGDSMAKTALSQRLIARKRDLIKRAMATHDGLRVGRRVTVHWEFA